MAVKMSFTVFHEMIAKYFFLASQKFLTSPFLCVIIDVWVIRIRRAYHMASLTDLGRKSIGFCMRAEKKEEPHRQGRGRNRQVQAQTANRRGQEHSA